MIYLCLTLKRITDMTASQIIATRSSRSEFTQLSAAQGFVLASPISHKLAIIMGDNGRHWVLTTREASILVAAGYEYASQF